MYIIIPKQEKRHYQYQKLKKEKHLVPTNIIIKIIEYYKHLFDNNFDNEKKYAIA